MIQVNAKQHGQVWVLTRELMAGVDLIEQLQRQADDVTAVKLDTARYYLDSAAEALGLLLVELAVDEEDPES